MKDEEAARDDDEVEPHQHSAHGDVLVLVHYGSDDVRAARGAVVDEHQRQRSTFDAGAYHGGHERLVAYDLGKRTVGQRNDILYYAEKESDAYGGVDGLGKELEAKNLQTYGQKNGIYDKIAILCRKTCGIKDDGRDTCHATWSEFVRQHKGAETDAIAQASEGNEDVVLDFVENPT